MLDRDEITETQYNKLTLQKDDIKITESFELWNRDNINIYFPKKTVIADYCIQDCELVLSLAQ